MDRNSDAAFQKGQSTKPSMPCSGLPEMWVEKVWGLYSLPLFPPWCFGIQPKGLHVLGTFFTLNSIPDLERVILLSSGLPHRQTKSKGLSCLPQNCAPVRTHLENMSPISPGKG